MRSLAIRSAADALSPVASVPRPAGAPPRLADYELLRQIGAGAYGEVWLGRSTTGAWRAVKLVYRASFADERPFLREFEGIQKFEAISRSHPSQLALFHVGRNEATGCFYYVMELADAVTTASGQSSAISEQSSGAEVHAPSGSARNTDPLITDYSPRTLRSDLNAGRLPAARVLELALALTEALGQLHASGLVHRDIKPSNIIFVNGRPKLADIGLVTDATTGDDRRSIVGTEGYLPPEGPGTPAADLFALGRVLYEALTGLDRRRYPELPADLRTWPDARLAFELNAVLLKAADADARQRYPSAEAMRADLERLAAGKSVKGRQAWQRRIDWGTKLASAAGVVGLLVVGFLLARNRSVPPVASSSQVEIFETSGTTNHEAYDLYQLGRKCREDDTAAGHLKAIAYFERATARDPKFARAYAAKASSYSRLDAKEETKPSVCRPKSRDAALQALALDESLSEAHVALGSYKFSFEWDWAGAEKSYRRAIELAPGDPGPKAELAWLCSFTGRHDQAIQLMREMIAAHPDAVWLNTNLGKVLAFAGRLAEAEVAIRHHLEIAPNAPSPQYQLAMLRWARGDIDEARDLFDRFHVLVRGRAVEGGAHQAYIKAGRGPAGLMAYSRMLLEGLEQGARKARSEDWIAPMNYAWCHMLAGETDEAYLWWNRALDERQPMALFAVIDPFFASLWRDPRFVGVLKRTGLDRYFPERLHEPAQRGIKP